MSPANQDHRPRGAAGDLKWPLIGIFLILAVTGLTLARNFLMPIVLACLLALVFAPLRRWLYRHGIPSSLSAFVIVVSIMVGGAAVVASVAVPAREWVSDAPQILAKVERRLSELKPVADRLRELDKSIGDVMEGESVPTSRADTPAQVAGAEPPKADVTGDGKGDTIVVQSDKTSSFLVQAATTAPTMVAQSLFTMILLFFLLGSGDMFLEKIVRSAPTRTEKERAISIVVDIERKLSRYLFTITLINAGLGVSIGLTMWMFGMPSPLLFGVIGFLFNFAPYVGAISGTVIALVVGIVSLDSLGGAFGAAAAYFALTSIEGQLVTPWLVGRNLRLNTVVVFVSVMFWAWTWSVVGILVATPLLVSIRTFCEHVPSLRSLGRFLSDSRPSDAQDELINQAERQQEVP